VTRRTSLQPVDAPPSAEAPANAPLPPPARDQRAPFPRSLLLVAALGVAALIVGGGVLTRITAAPATTAAPAQQACPSVASYLEVIAGYERQARWSLAATTAQTAMHTPGLCETDRAALGQKAIALGQQALFEQPAAPEDAPGQKRVVAAYADLKSLATTYGAQPPAPLPIAQSAYDKRLFLLAAAAYADAFIDGDSSTQDRDVVRADYAAQYNLGLAWAERTDTTQHADGLARLATACSIDERQQLGSPEACNELQKLLGARSRWPAPLPDPLVNVAGSQP